MIEVERLSKSYGAFRAVSDVSFHVERGEVVGFLGPNGAGKSTTLRMLAGFLGPSAGRIRIGGHDIAEEPLLAREKLGYMPETSPLYPEMRVREYLTFRAEVKRVPRSARAKAVERAAEEARVDDVADVLVQHLSKGYRQRVGLADALLGDPPVLILDEPTAGLDPNQIREVRELVKRRGKDHAILISTHILSEVEATCSRALVVARGKLVASGTIEELREMRRASGLRIVVRGDATRALGIVRALPEVAGADIDAGQAPAADAAALLVTYRRAEGGAEAAERVVAALVGAGLGVREVVPRAATLEQVFSELTRGDETAAEVQA
ncbi:ABC transporter ATP-binding protein [Polyangium jinanense]|uniref:ABC transporter ATP-binding protein n=1 Tax=Polyangium jinanense TaxID=2829994 RepID=A0A9X3X5U2_9BACT|nr:ABC transporter ATP-binding protein [Polyangium jinanense]MDC3959665.1 ABC transporter ATP-binding protein [Polyangium jinanense]MDC3984167.1 ABC transporter ATP-binding protein [Polyangium jinanense]